MKVTNALIDKCSELWLSAAMEHGFGPIGFETMREDFLREYLGAIRPITGVTMTPKEAKAAFDFDAWKDAYNRYYEWLYGEQPPQG